MLPAGRPASDAAASAPAGRRSARRGQRHEDGDQRRRRRSRSPRRRGRAASPARQSGGPGSERDQHLGGVSPRAAASVAGGLGPRGGAAGEGAASGRPRSSSVAARSASSRPASAARSTAAASAGRPASVGVDPAAVQEPEVAAGAAGVPHREHQPGEDAGGLVGGVRSGPVGGGDAELLEPARGWTAGEPRVRIDRVRTASIVAAALSSWAQKASRRELGVLEGGRGGQQPRTPRPPAPAGRRAPSSPPLRHEMAISARAVIQVYESTGPSSGHLSLARTGGRCLASEVRPLPAGGRSC